MANLVFDFLHHYVTGERRASDPADAYQYDEGHVMEAVVPVAVTSCEIHYWVRGQEEAEAYVPESITQNEDGSYSIIGHIPNTYFETYGELRVYIVVTDGTASITTYEGRIHICERSKPDDYVDDDPENEATRVLNEAREAAATATAAAETCEEVLESIPEDYSQLSDDVSDLKDGLSDMSTATASDVGKALKAKTVTNGKVTEWEFGEAGGGLSEDTKQALLACFNHVAWDDTDPTGQSYIDTLEEALYPTVKLTSISCVYTQSDVVYNTDSLESLKDDLVVTAHYSDYSTQTVTTYVLSGTLTEGTSTITVSYGGKTTTFTVTVTQLLPTGYTKLDYVWSYGNSTRSPIYVNTGVIPTANTSFEYKVSRDTLPDATSGNNSGGHICSTENYYVPFLRYYQPSGQSPRTSLFSNRTGAEIDSDSLDGQVFADTPMEISAFNNGNDVVLDGTTLYSSVAGVKVPSKQLTLFTYNGNTSVTPYLFVGKLYYMKIYENGTMIREYIPCKNSDNVVGLYDKVNDTFNTSATAYALSAPNA